MLDKRSTWLIARHEVPSPRLRVDLSTQCLAMIFMCFSLDAPYVLSSAWFIYSAANQANDVRANAKDLRHFARRSSSGSLAIL